MFDFPKSNRIRKRAEYTSTLDDGERAVSREFVIVSKMSNPPAHPRLGMIVSKKVGNAVTRNRVKRIIRETFRTIDSQLLDQGRDYVVIARVRAGTMTKKNAARNLRQALLRGAAS